MEKHWRAEYSERRKPGSGRGGQKSIGNDNSLAAYSTLWFWMRTEMSSNKHKNS